MKPIQPIDIRREGKTVEANTIDMRLVGDNLSDSCTVFYELFSKSIEEGENIVDGETVTVEIPRYVSLATGNETVSGEEYEEWDNSNEQLYEIVCKRLNIKLL